MHTMINGSQKINNSNSRFFLEYICKKLNKNIFDLNKDSFEDILNNIQKNEFIVLAFPLYVDSPPTLVLKLFDYIIDNDINIKGKKIYVIINCGFREGEQNLVALNIVKNWCRKTQSIYMGSILIGAGEIVGKEKYRIISNRALTTLKSFKKSIEEKRECGDNITTMDLLTNKTYCFLANKSWNKKGKKNKLSHNDLKFNEL